MPPSVYVPIAVAIIGGPLMVLIARFDKKNTQQHSDNTKILERIEEKVDKVDDRVSGHIEWHLEKNDTQDK